jgi:hypothetical protein
MFEMHSRIFCFRPSNLDGFFVHQGKSTVLLDPDINYNNQSIFKCGLREFSIALYYP